MTEPIPTILMLPQHGHTPVEQWVAEGRLAACLDLVARLNACGCYDPIVAIVEDPEDERALFQHGVDLQQRAEETFHFGRVLTRCLRKNSFERFAYFGGASAPLLLEADLKRLSDQLNHADEPLVITNNLYSSDWFLCNLISQIGTYEERLPSDNPFGWVISQEAGIRVQREPPSAATRLDIDTPMDFAMLIGHPAVGHHLGDFLERLPDELKERVEKIKQIIATPAQTLVVIGRASAHLWQQLEEQTQIWIRLFVEERGMVASRRVARNEVRSLIALLIRMLGPKVFVEELVKISDAVLWDTRVWMAAQVGWPSAAERFAFDLGRTDELENKDLRELSDAIKRAGIPILAGGYGVVAGGLYALLESMEVG
jgi:hypothetical protein